MILGKPFDKTPGGKSSKLNLPSIGNKRSPYEIEGPSDNDDARQPTPNGQNLDFWLSNQNYKVRDYQIKDAFIKTEQKMESKSRIDAMLSGTTCVVTFFNHDMILCANCGDSRAILISENEQKTAKGETNFYFTQLSRDHKPDLQEEAQRIIARNGRIEPSRLTPDMLFGAAGGFGARRGKMN